MDGRGIAAALALGAQAAQMGTAFLSTEESGICDAYKAALPASRPSSRASPGPFRDGRHAASPMHSCATWTLIRPTSCPYPLQNALTRPMRNAGGRAGDIDVLSLWAGQGAPMARRERRRAGAPAGH